MVALYDTIGRGYAEVRKPDPRIANAIRHALGDADSVVNVGAGAGSYEPSDRYVVAVEPSMTMIAQRSARSAAAVQATAMSLPFENDSFDAALAVLTVHHWPNKALGLVAAPSCPLAGMTHQAERPRSGRPMARRTGHVRFVGSVRTLLSACALRNRGRPGTALVCERVAASARESDG